MPTTLAQERARRGWSQKQLADLIGLRDGTTVCRWEQRNRRPYARHAVRLEAIFGMPVDRLLQNANSPSTTSDAGAANPTPAKK